eukprot:g9739.t1
MILCGAGWRTAVRVRPADHPQQLGGSWGMEVPQDPLSCEGWSADPHRTRPGEGSASLRATRQYCREKTKLWNGSVKSCQWQRNRCSEGPRAGGSGEESAQSPAASKHPQGNKPIECAAVKKIYPTWPCYDYKKGMSFDEHATCTAGEVGLSVHACFATPGAEKHVRQKDAKGNVVTDAKGNPIWVSKDPPAFFGKEGDPNSYQSCCHKEKKEKNDNGDEPPKKAEVVAQSPAAPEHQQKHAPLPVAPEPEQKNAPPPAAPKQEQKHAPSPAAPEQQQKNEHNKAGKAGSKPSKMKSQEQGKDHGEEEEKDENKEDQSSFLDWASFLEDDPSPTPDEDIKDKENPSGGDEDKKNKNEKKNQAEAKEEVPCATIKKKNPGQFAGSKDYPGPCYDAWNDMVFDEHATCTAGKLDMELPDGKKPCFATPGTEVFHQKWDAKGKVVRKPNGDVKWFSYKPKKWFGKKDDPNSYQSCCRKRKAEQAEAPPSAPGSGPKAPPELSCATIKKYFPDQDKWDGCYDAWNGMVFDEDLTCTAGKLGQDVQACFATPGAPKHVAGGKKPNGETKWVPMNPPQWFGKKDDPNSYQSCCRPIDPKHAPCAAVKKMFPGRECYDAWKGMFFDEHATCTAGEVDRGADACFATPGAEEHKCKGEGKERKCKSLDPKVFFGKEGDPNSYQSCCRDPRTVVKELIKHCKDYKTPDECDIDEKCKFALPDIKVGKGEAGGCGCILLILFLALAFLVAVGVAVYCFFGGRKEKQAAAAGGDGGAAPAGEKAKSKDDKGAGQEQVEQDDSHLSSVDGAAAGGDAGGQPAQQEEAATSKPGEGGEVDGATNKEGEDAATGGAEASAPAEEKKEEQEEPTSEPEHLADLNKGSMEQGAGADEDEDDEDEDAGE